MSGKRFLIFLFFFIIIQYTVQSQVYYWVGSGSNWNNTNNWSATSGGTTCTCAPGTGDVATFDGNSGSCTIDVAVDVLGIDMQASYSGNITQGANNITLGASNFSIAGGTFTGNSTATTTTFDNNGNFSISGGTFIQGSNNDLINDGNFNQSAGTFTGDIVDGTFTVGDDFTYSGGTFTAPFTVTFDSDAGTSEDLAVAGNAGFTDVIIDGSYNYEYNINGNLTIAGNLTLNATNGSIILIIGAANTIAVAGNLTYGTGAGGTKIRIFTGTITVAGNINLTHQRENLGAGDGTVRVVGTGAQTVNGAAAINLSTLPYFDIDKPSGTLTINNFMTVSHSFTVTDNGAGITTTGSTVKLGGTPGNGNTFEFTAPSSDITFNNLTVSLADHDPLILNADLDVNGDLTNVNSSGISANGNTIFLAGDWINQDVSNNTYDGFVEGTSLVVFDGNTQQTISSVSDPASDSPDDGVREIFYNIRIDNTFGTAPQVVLGSNVRITNSMDLVDGVISSNGNNFILGEDVTTSNSSTASYIIGPVIKELTNGGSFQFPMGDAGVFAPITTASIVAGTGTQTFTANYTRADFGDPDFEAPLTGVEQATHYWDLTASTAPNGGITSADVTIVSTISDCGYGVFAHYSGTVWQNLVQDNCNTGTPGFITKNTIASFGSFTLGISSVLPIELIDFSGKFTESNSILKWSTASEINNDFFEIQRSIGRGIKFITIDKVQGNGTSSVENNYHYTDYNLPEGPVYYRLKQVDFDGQWSYSPVIRGFIKGSKRMWLSNSICCDEIYIYGRPYTEIYKIDIYDAKGREIAFELLENRIVLTNPQTRGLLLIAIYTESEVLIDKVMICH